VIRALLVLFSAAALLVLLPWAQGQTIPAARNVVSPAAYASYNPVARGHEIQLAVVLKIRDGYHINARKPTLDYLIPTDLKMEATAGFQPGEVVYPSGKLKTFAFAKTQPLNVYQGTVILRLPIEVAAAASTGEQHIPLKLRYQACSNEVCLPPVTVSVDAAVNVTASAASAKPAHPELFPAKEPAAAKKSADPKK
jgi:Thiol:disulfide interchange protein DsbD, N-terminal